MDLATLIARQRAYFSSGATLGESFRRAALGQLASSVARWEKRLSDALHEDLRRSPADAYTSELALIEGEAWHAERNVRAWMRPQRRKVPLLAWPGRGRVEARPLGLALIISPWNYPFQLSLLPLIGAIAAGNCAIIKPSELAPNSSGALAEFVSAAFSSDHVAVAQGDAATARALIALRFDTIFFTGGAKTGRAVLAEAAPHLTPVTLELGGKCPCVVFADAPLRKTARRIVWGKFLNAGQTCVAPDFLLVDSRVHDAMIREIVETIHEFFGPDPRSNPNYGRIINAAHVRRLVGCLGRASVVCGGEHDEADRYFAPTVLTNVADDAPAMNEEVFGPILPVLAFDHPDEALDRINSAPPPLSLYLFTGNRTLADRFINQTRSGGVSINDTVIHAACRELPLGGVGESGMGRYRSRASFDCFSQQRPVLWRSFAIDFEFRYPHRQLPLERIRQFYRLLLGR